MEMVAASAYICLPPEPCAPSPMLEAAGICTAGLLTLAIIWTLHRLSASRNFVSLIPGPKCTSWLYGNIPELLLAAEYGENEFQWQETYGQVYSVKGCFGEPLLMISDPVPVKFVTNSSVFAIGPSLQKATNAMFGSGSVATEPGDAHRRLRNIMNPAFSSSNMRASLPIISECARKLVDQWEALGYPGTTVDISRTLNDAALDVMGAAILDHPFDALAGHSELARIQRKMLDSASSPTKFAQLIDATLPYIPDVILRLAWQLPIGAMRTFHEHKKITDELALQLVEQKRRDEVAQDFMSALVVSGVPEKQIGAQLRTILIAGQDTSGITMGWILYRLAQMPEYQQELRQEIQLAKVDGQPDYNNMPLLNAMINEVLRMYCAFPLAERVAAVDCIIPLSQPITTITGTRISEIPIKRGQRLYVAISAYHRLRAIWGPDADEFRPSRWLEKEPCKGQALGPYASLLSFLGGPRVCIGWRLAVLEFQVLIVEILSRFTLTLPDNDSVRARLAMTLVAETADGTRQIPLHIEPVM
ncbi:cytochrome P450 [Mycena galericulata]|nr:cytochrome P450 [Mycena galericulata]